MNGEDEFLRRQALAKAQYRAREKRVRPIDLILMNAEGKACQHCFVLDSVEMVLEAVERVDLSELSHFRNVNNDPLLREYIGSVFEMKKLISDVRSSSSYYQLDPPVIDYLQTLNHGALVDVSISVREKLAGGVNVDVDYWMAMELKVKLLLHKFALTSAFTRLLDRRKQSCEEYDVVTEEYLEVPETDKSKSEVVKKPTFDRWTIMVAKWMRAADADPLTAIQEPNDNHDGVCPRYTARLLMHVKWTRLNERRHDSLNPPPRLCTGLSLLVDYQQLGPEEVPVYRLDRPTIGQTSENGTRTLTITAPRLYSPLQFTIPASPWDCSPKKGFRFSFDRGILLLHVRFKRQ
jgi:hypothetical protein